LTAPPPPTPAPPGLEAERPLNDLQIDLMTHHEQASRENFKRPTRQGDLHKFLTKHFESAISKVKEANSMLEFIITVESSKTPGLVEDSFKIENRKVYSKTLKGGPGNATHFCLTQSASSSEPLTPQLCLKSGTSQTFDYGTDGTLKNVKGECVTAVNTDSDTTMFGIYKLYMKPCDGSVFQGFSLYPYDSIYLGDVGGTLLAVEKKNLK
jgi:hypothetical protein